MKPNLIPSLNLSIFTFFLLSETCVCQDSQFVACSPRQCGNQSISFPFWIEGEQESYCGYPGFVLACPHQQPILRMPDNEYIIEEIFYNNQSLHIRNSAVSNSGSVCVSRIQNTSLNVERYRYASDVSYLNLLSNCTSPLPEEIGRYRVDCTGVNGDEWGLAMSGREASFGNASEGCTSRVSAPVEAVGGDGIEDYTEALRRGFWLRWMASNCSRCARSGGRCGYEWSSLHFKCFCPDRPHASHCASSSGNKTDYKMILGIAIPGAAILTFLIMLVIHRRNKWGYVPSYFLSRNTSSDPSSRADLEAGSIYFGVHVFTYAQLEEATDNFDPSKELGDGGFGTVYYGKLRDGREVAVKRLYEHNYKRMEQFMNEIEILTRLHHPNLVTLYGCTSRHSRELLLVYEYIPKGTVADHLHGEQAKPGSLPWPVRMNIAIETASALAYLHASDIIHRDVKTNNILLDSNFCVKVADFGLSRLFPTDVTHVSTAPQGTPGYVDPEYHQCYQLTDKSDVYSFGVVLIELISSMPAVDISRHRHEINLANLALNRIQNCALNELVDSSLGFTSDAMVERMTTSVAELAFQCLQYERELRPSMDDVLKALMEIQGQEYKDDKLIDNVGVLGSEQPPPSPESDDAVLLKSSNQLPHSPNSVTNKWDSMSTTPSTSGLHSA